MPQNFAGQDLRRKSFKGQDLTGADFSGADIRSANFRGAKLAGAKFCRTRAGLAWPASILKTMAAIILGGISGNFSTSQCQWFFAESHFLLERFKITDEVIIQAIIAIDVLLLFTGIIVEFIRKKTFWVGIVVISAAIFVFAISLESAIWTEIAANAIAARMMEIVSTIVIHVMPIVVSIIWIGAMVGLRAESWIMLGGVVEMRNIMERVKTDEILIEIVAVTGTIMFLVLGWYIRHRTFSEDPQFLPFRRFIFWFNSFGSTNFQQVDITAADFGEADMKHACFMNAILRRTDWQGAKHMNWAKLQGTILADQATRELLVTANAQAAIGKMWQPSPTAFVGKNLKGAYLVNADLSHTDFTEADFSGGDLTGANLRHVNLTKATLLGVNLRGADLSGATLEAWNIDSTTQLEGAHAEYVYLKAKQQERRPQSGAFGHGEFSKLFQEMLDTVDFIFQNGIDWQAFILSFDQLREKIRVESDGAEIVVQSIENKGDGVFVVRVAVPEGVNKEVVHQTGVELYQQQLALQEAKYQALLAAKDEQVTIYQHWLADKHQENIRMEKIIQTIAHQPEDRLKADFEAYRQQHARPKTKILFLAANPAATARLKLDQEVRTLQTNLKLAKERDNLELKQEWAVTIDTLMQAMLDEEPQIVHFSGHGEQAGIKLENVNGEPHFVSTEALASLFKQFQASVRCVVLNACYSEAQAQAIKMYIPFVIGMSDSVNDSIALAFANGFYKAIGAGKSIPEAFELGKTAIQLAGLSGSDLPVLL